MAKRAKDELQDTPGYVLMIGGRCKKCAFDGKEGKCIRPDSEYRKIPRCHLVTMGYYVKEKNNV